MIHVTRVPYSCCCSQGVMWEGDLTSRPPFACCYRRAAPPHMHATPAIGTLLSSHPTQPLQGLTDEADGAGQHKEAVQVAHIHHLLQQVEGQCLGGLQCDAHTLVVPAANFEAACCCVE